MITIPGFVVEFFSQFGNFAFVVFDNIKWLLLLAFLIPLTRSTLLYWRQQIFQAKLKFVTLEIRMPREILKSPRGMDQVFKALSQLRNTPGNPQEKYLDGEVTVPITFEIVSFGGETHFYARVWEKMQGLVEAAFVAYYPDIEFVEVPDFAEQFPRNFSDAEGAGLDVYGGELQLAREPAYPIKTYIDFETPEESQQFDPMSNLLEFMGKLKPGQIFALQFIVQAKDPVWGEEWESLLNELRKTKFSEPTSAAAFAAMEMRSPGQTDVLKAIEQNISKPAFDTFIRFIYMSPKELYFYPFAIWGVMNSFNQYAASNLNSFKPNRNTLTKIKIWQFPHILIASRMRLRKSRLISDFRNRETQPETFMGRLLTSHVLNWNFHSKPITLNSEALATLFHPPTWPVITAPHLDRVASRKGGPSAGMEIFGDESEIADFQ